ncbi:ATP-binding protein [Peribacillus sp. NJ11]|uniref:two-component system sensor histidine kinase NtrB n=1 Tax=Peribacillus sp. NJ11 TaxID=3055861 RepID=UPI0025A03EEB|nr:ATP-binding protein [Peribacillus sp. NJ11]MDM5222866.1 ATP-binding protein [Peribacillus sp. NJ11]
MIYLELKIGSHELDFHQLIEYSLNSIWIVGEEGKILYCNRACLELLKLDSPEDILYKDLYAFLPPEIHAGCKERLNRVLENQEIVELAEQKMICGDGDIINIEVTAAPFYLKDIPLAQVIIRNITDRKRAERAEILLKERVKLASIGQIAAGIVHEVKNPLTTVKGFLQLLKESQPHPYFDTIETELEKALETLQNLLQVSKPDLHEEPIVPIDLCKELASILFLFQEQLYKVEIEWALRDTERKVVGKRNLFLKAFFNLLKNAIEAMDEIQGKRKIRIEHYYKTGQIHIKVSDTGVGISEDKLKMLGTPFFSTKSEGTGLGLTQVFTTIHKHGGNISVQSVVGKGTTFHVQLPVK